MSEVRPAEILRHLDESAPADRDLFARFLCHDQTAFTRLVRRHGPMVLAVCRRIVGHPQDAEDAFQAAFLVLAQKAASVSNPDLLGNWLYGVAVRVAQKARRTASRRRAREVQVTAMPDPVASGEDPPFDIGPLLHDELAKLPAVYRDAIVLCDLRGVSRSDAAVALGVPEGTLSSRLANGRKKLADRLARRGIALGVTAIPAALAVGRAAVPETLIATTCGLAADWAAGGAVAGSVLRLAHGGFDVRKILAVGVLGAALTAAGVVIAGGRDANPQKPKDPLKPPPVVAKVDAAKPDPKAVTFTTSPRLVNRHDIDAFNATGTVRWNTAGTRVVVAGTEIVNDPKMLNGHLERKAIRVVSLEPWTVHALQYPDKQTLVGFAPDGVQVLTELREHELLTGHHRMTFWQVAPPAAPGVGGEGSPTGPPPGLSGPGRGGEAQPHYEAKRSVNLTPDRTAGYAFAADGKSYRTVVVETDAAGETSRLEVREVETASGDKLKSLWKGESNTFALSPDGKRLAVVTANDLVVIDVDTKKSRAAQLPPPDKDHAKDSPNVALVFSADGKRVVFGGRFGRTHVVNADTGDLLPPLEGLTVSETNPQPHALTADGRLVALSGSRYTVSKVVTGAGRNQTSITRAGQFVGVWDTQTGKALKIWDRGAIVGFSPVRPILATLEKTSSTSTRLGLWDFAADDD